MLLEGVPGLAKTLTVKTLAQVLGGTLPPDPVHPRPRARPTSSARASTAPTAARFDTELGPVFANFLLADEINRAPAKVQSALLEVMQEHQVTIGGTSYPVPRPFLVMATQNPIESEGTYPLPEAQIDRFLMKILVDYPTRRARRRRSSGAASAEPADGPRVRLARRPRALRRARARTVLVDREVIAYAVALADATPQPARSTGSRDLEALIEFGASPRGPIGLAQAARVLALLRGRGHVTGDDVRDLAADVLRHRLVLSYHALSDGVTADHVIEQVLVAVPEPRERPPATVTRSA